MRITILIITIIFSVVGFGQIYSYGPVIPDTTTFFYPIRYGPVIPLDSFNKYIKPILDGMEVENDTTTIPKVDSMDMKVISMKEFNAYLEKINLVIKKQFDLTEVTKYEQILKTIQLVYAEADKKRRMK